MNTQKIAIIVIIMNLFVACLPSPISPTESNFAKSLGVDLTPTALSTSSFDQDPAGTDGPSRVSSDSLAVTPTSVPPTPTAPLDFSSLEFRGLDLSIIPSLDQIPSMYGCHVVFFDACLELRNTILLQGTAAKKHTEYLISEGTLSPMYGEHLDQIAQNYRIFVIPRMYLIYGYSAFVYVPGADYVISPAAISQPENYAYATYQAVFLLPRDTNVYILGLYKMSNGEIIALYNVSTGIE